MKSKKLLVIFASIALLAIIWVTVITNGPRAQAKQNALINEAKTMLADEIYKPALPILSEAVAIDAKNKNEAFYMLLECYKGLDDTNAAEKLMAQLVEEGQANEQIYLELIKSYSSRNKLLEAITLCEEGIELYNSAAISEFYETIRYTFSRKYNSYDKTFPLKNGFVIAVSEGKYGALTADGSVAVGFTFDKISSFSQSGKAFAIDNGRLVLIDSTGARLAAAGKDAQDFVGMDGSIGAIKYGDVWKLADETLVPGKREHEMVTEISNGYYAAKEKGKWLIYDSKMEAISPELDEILVDENNYAINNERAFAKKGGNWMLIDLNGQQVGTETYEDARVFQDSYAAVYNEGNWFFIDKDGKVVLTGEFEDAKSFACGLAPVKIGGFWGFVTAGGKMAQEPVYNDLQAFIKGCGALREGDMWHLAQMKRYSK